MDQDEIRKRPPPPRMKSNQSLRSCLGDKAQTQAEAYGDCVLTVPSLYSFRTKQAQKVYLGFGATCLGLTSSV